MSEAAAYDMMRAHHRALTEQFGELVRAVAESAAAGQPSGGAARLAAFLTEHVLPHALAEEQTIYTAAAEHTELAETIIGMTAEHEALAAAAGNLAGMTDDTAAAAQAAQVGALFAAHVARENDVVLPALLADPDADLAELLTELHQRTRAATPPANTAATAGRLAGSAGGAGQ
jgi:iron-sulfur cluster repair protein YtfE (RIC family)